MTEITQEQAMLSLAVLAYEAERAEGRSGGEQFNAAVKLLDDVSAERRTFWRMQLTTIRTRYGN